MMKQITRTNTWPIHLATFGIPLALLLFAVLFIRSSYFANDPEMLSLAITLDLLVTIPFVYFLLIRKQDISKLTVVTVFIIGLVVGSYVLPSTEQFWLTQVKYFILPIIEGSIFIYVVLQARKTLRAYRTHKDESTDFYSAILTACQEVLPGRLSSLLATELAVIYYSFFSWKTVSLSANAYSYHKKNGIIAVLVAFLFLIVIETFAIHIAVQSWSPTVAWVLSALSVYTCFQLFALIRSMKKRPVLIDTQNDQLILRFGFLSETKIPLAAIERIEQTSSTIAEDSPIVRFSPLSDLSAHNLILHLTGEQTLYKPYGFTAPYNALAFYIDEKEAFVEQLERAKIGCARDME